ncbi:MAG: NAD(P)/FAD-dependent oxidoreductase [bacterium]|nr:NAD(P)/FAD-dependent oxidoreductase [bacterium]MCP5070115.1 NAD(P)/FAD-dependent oxidoreductase [bacterium]
MGSRIRSVAIIGGGPAGSALAYYLGRAGRKVVLFDKGNRPPIIVGESLVPATVPFLAELGIEEEVRGYSTFKEGASFIFNSEESLSFKFADVRGAKTNYSYNVPRDKLDASISEVAARSGAKLVRETARVERVGQSDRVQLAPETLAQTEGYFEGQPDLIVDASGRPRMLPNLLDLPYQHGDRRDTALFAHCQGIAQVVEGNVHTDTLTHGWSWRIPLPGKMSVGFVVDSDYVKTLGADLEEQFDAILAREPVIKLWGDSPKRITPVLKYTNYQLVSKRGFGDGWVLLGDTFGFVDPVFSSGLLLAFDGAKALSTAILAGGDERAMRRYDQHVRHHIQAWQKTIDHFYDGRLFTLFKVGEVVRHTPIGRLMDFHFRKHVPRVFTGEASSKRYSPALVDFMCRYALMDNDPSALAIR